MNNSGKMAVIPGKIKKWIFFDFNPESVENKAYSGLKSENLRGIFRFSPE
jgi:hypothetical protein